MGIDADTRPFPEALVHRACWDMSLVYSAADVVMCRAGASTLAELQSLGIPAVAVPWLRSADNHQIGNAQSFEFSAKTQNKIRQPDDWVSGAL